MSKYYQKCHQKPWGGFSVIVVHMCLSMCFKGSSKLLNTNSKDAGTQEHSWLLGHYSTKTGRKFCSILCVRLIFPLRIFTEPFMGWTRGIWVLNCPILTGKG